jgi:hypothetical protein
MFIGNTGGTTKENFDKVAIIYNIQITHNGRYTNPPELPNLPTSKFKYWRALSL